MPRSVEQLAMPRDVAVEAHAQAEDVHQAAHVRDDGKSQSRLVGRKAVVLEHGNTAAAASMSGGVEAHTALEAARADSARPASG